MTSKPPGWPWRLNDEREHGWFIDGNSTRYGPLPKRLRYVSPNNTYAPMTPRVDRSREAPPPQRLIDPWRRT